LDKDNKTNFFNYARHLQFQFLTQSAPPKKKLPIFSYTSQGSPARTRKALRSITPGWGDACRLEGYVPASCSSQSFVPFPLPSASGHAMPAMPTKQQRSGAADPLEAGRNAPEQTIFKTCFIGIFSSYT